MGHVKVIVTLFLFLLPDLLFGFSNIFHMQGMAGEGFGMRLCEWL